MSLLDVHSHLTTPVDWALLIGSFFVFHVTLWSYRYDGAEVYKRVARGRTGINCFTRFAPTWVYPPVWFILNTLLAVGAWLTIRRPAAYDDNDTWVATMAVWFAFLMVLKFWNVFFNTPYTMLYVIHVALAIVLNVALVILTAFGSEESNDFVFTLIATILSLCWLLLALGYAIGMHRLRDEVRVHFNRIRAAREAILDASPMGDYRM